MSLRMDRYEKIAKKAGVTTQQAKAVIEDFEEQLKHYISNPEDCGGYIRIYKGINFTFRINKAVRDWYECLLGYNSNHSHLETYNKLILPKLHRYVKARKESDPDSRINENPGGTCSGEISGKERNAESMDAITGADWSVEPTVCKKHSFY